MNDTLKSLLNNPGFKVENIGYTVSIAGGGLEFNILAYAPFRPQVKEPINELENPCGEITLTKSQPCTLTHPMNNTKLVTQNHFIEAIKEGGNYIVGSVDNFGNISFSNNPANQPSAAHARAECKRLAKLTPGKLYLFVTLEGAEMVPANTLSI